VTLRPAFAPTLAAGLVALAACLAAAPARAGTPDATAAEGPRADVAVLRPVSDDPILLEASARLQLELGAGGLTSAVVDAGDAFDARVALVREDGVVTIDVLGTPASGAALHRRVSVPREDGGDDPAVIAVRAAELLRGIRLEVRRAAPARPARVAAAEPDAEVAVPHAQPPDWRFEAGAGVLSGRPFAAAVALGPVLAAAGPIAPHLSFTASFAGPFFTQRPPTPDGSAHTHEEMGAIGLRIETWRPLVNVHAVASVGVHHVSAVYDGRGEMAAAAPSAFRIFTPQSVWNPVIALAGGASARLSRHLGVSLQLTVLLIQPALELTSSERSLGILGGPSLLGTVSAWSTL
jgi:hypothetical protein